MTKKKQEKHERTTYFYGITDGEVDTITIQYDSLSDSFSFSEIDKSTAKTVTHYTRNSGKEKTSNSVPCPDGTSSIEPAQDLLKKYSSIFSIDTNNFFSNEARLSVASVYLLERFETKALINHFYSFCLVNVKENINPEVIAWHIFLSTLTGNFNSGIIALITDSELGKHQKFNNRTEPYYKNYLLPQYVKLIYSSSDKKNDALPNHMIYLCDKASRMVIDKLAQLRIKLPPLTDGDENFDGFFVISSSSSENVEAIEFNRKI